MTTVEIKDYYTDAVLYTHEPAIERAAAGFALRDAMEAASLAGVNLAGANLPRANLFRANLAGANLAGADLAGAYLADGLLAVSKRPLLQIGPIGSRSAQLSIWLTEKCVYAQTGCFWGPLDDFEAEVRAKYASDSTHGHEYAAAIALARSHAQHWTPITTTAAE